MQITKNAMTTSHIWNPNFGLMNLMTTACAKLVVLLWCSSRLQNFCVLFLLNSRVWHHCCVTANCTIINSKRSGLVFGIDANCLLIGASCPTIFFSKDSRWKHVQQWHIFQHPPLCVVHDFSVLRLHLWQTTGWLMVARLGTIHCSCNIHLTLDQNYWKANMRV